MMFDPLFGQLVHGTELVTLVAAMVLAVAAGAVVLHVPGVTDQLRRLV